MHKYQFHRLPRTPFDPDGERWCRACQALTVSAFPAGERQYVCQQHLWQCCMKPRTERCWATGTGCMQVVYTALLHEATQRAGAGPLNPKP